MLDLGAVKRQINQMARDQKAAQDRFRRKMHRVLEELRRWSEEWRILADKVSRSRTSWLVAGATGSLDGTSMAPERPKRISVLATDGSQIFPDRHEISPCYLINIGYVSIHYGTGERPVLASRPLVFHKEHDLHQNWGGRRMSMNSELLGIKRGALEFEELARLGEEAREEDRIAVGLSDGTLILWPLEGAPPDFRAKILNEYLSSIERLRSAGVPLAGYISHPNSADVINALRVGLCPEEIANCDRCSWREEPEDDEGFGGRWRSEPPCSEIKGVTDRLLFSELLDKDERSVVFRSSSRILGEYGPHRVCFFYVNVGTEIARVEIPQWVAEEDGLLDLVHACVCDQAEKGQGYPVTLSEAHEKAVVRSADREMFYRFLRDTFVQHEISARLSSKRFRKRGPTV